MSELREKLDQEIEAHNQLHNNITAGEEQLAAMKEERAARRGRVMVLQELVAQEGAASEQPGDDASLAVEAETAGPAPDGQPEVEG